MEYLGIKLKVMLVACWAIAGASLLHGQLCAGKVNFQVFSGSPPEAVLFEAPALGEREAKSISTDEVRFSLEAKGDGTLRRFQGDGFEFMMLDYGCAQEMQLKIRNQKSHQKMQIHFVNLCDVQLGMMIPFQKGKFEVDGCSSLGELKKTGKMCNGGWDITPEPWKKLLTGN